MSDLWAYCEPCARWFYPDSDEAVAGRTPACPVCSTEAVTLAENPDEAPESPSSV